MRRMLACLLCMLLIFSTAWAGGLSDLLAGMQLNALPDPKALLDGGATLYDENFALDEEQRGIAYAYPMPEDWEQFLAAYTALCEEAGYAVAESRQLGLAAWEVRSGGKSAWLIPDYKGCLLVAVNREIPFAPIPTPEPTATPRPTAAPTAVPRGHWEYISTQQDCFACVGGTCDLCNGSGWYRAYGEKVPCTIYCQTCDGLGWWTTQTAVWVYD